jgi:translation initiation factor 1 (eIF-1/SUI1)
MGKNNKRVDRSGDGTPLTDNPFAALGNMLDKNELQEHKQAPEAPAPDKEKVPAAWQVERSRKGGYKLRIEKRGGGKVVTLLEGVTDGGPALLKALKQRCASGGKVEGTTLVLQGEHREAVEAFLRDHA